MGGGEKRGWGWMGRGLSSFTSYGCVSVLLVQCGRLQKVSPLPFSFLYERQDYEAFPATLALSKIHVYSVPTTCLTC